MTAELSKQYDEWANVFAHRSSRRNILLGVSSDRNDRDPAVMQFLRAALYFERSGADILEGAAKVSHADSAAASLAYHAAEEREHVAILEILLGDQPFWRPAGPIRWAYALLSRRRPLPAQLVATLLVESLGVAVYSMTAIHLRTGRVAAALRYIADDERVHLDFTAELLANLTPKMTRRSLSRLRGLRNRLLASVLLAHTLGHRRYLEPVSGLGRTAARRLILDEVERSFSGVSALKTRVDRRSLLSRSPGGSRGT